MAARGTRVALVVAEVGVELFGALAQALVSCGVVDDETVDENGVAVA